MTRRARVPALAKINLDLRVLSKRPDGYHELRTIFQTISLADRLEIEYTPARQTSIELDDPLVIPDNLVVRAARAVMPAIGAKGRVAIRLEKRIPMGAGLGGGSSDAAAVLLALPALAGRLCRSRRRSRSRSSSAAMWRSSWSAELRQESAAAPSSFPCPTPRGSTEC
jgi:4-diphosphocytidyl-2-C-methyl-D-erythritol kinase